MFAGVFKNVLSKAMGLKLGLKGGWYLERHRGVKVICVGV